MPAQEHPARGRVGEPRERQDGLGEASPNHGAGHPPDRRRLLILGDHPPARLADVVGAAQAVHPHVRQHHAEGRRTEDGRRVPEEDIRRRAT